MTKGLFIEPPMTEAEAAARVTEIEITSKSGAQTRKITVGTPVIRRR